LITLNAGLPIAAASITFSALHVGYRAPGEIWRIGWQIGVAAVELLNASVIPPRLRGDANLERK
jgi:hypothetical protein